MSRYNYAKFEFDNTNFEIIRTTETYSPTASGKGWRSKPDDIKTESITAEHYTNYITAIPFFNRWGDGASCRASWEYTQAGFLPVRVTTVSPFRKTKKVATFRFNIL